MSIYVRCARWALCGALVGVGCTGGIRGGRAHDPQRTEPVAVPTADAGSAPCESAERRRVRRLSAREYLNVVSDLLGDELVAVAAPMLPAEPRVAGFDNQASALLVSGAFHEALAKLAERLSSQLDVAVLAPCEAPLGSAECLASFARAFTRKAYGRSPSDSELQDVLEVAALGADYEGSVRLVVELVLQSPHTLYATELGSDGEPAAGDVALTQHELATQLALLLTAARPDEELLRAAEAEQLADPAELSAQTERLLGTERGRQQLGMLIKGWLDLGAVGEAPKHPESFPELTPQVTSAMQEELDRFIAEHLVEGEGTLHALLTETSRDTPAALDAIYGGDTVDPQQRRGVLSLPGFLTYHSADQHSGPIERGLLVRRQLLCQTIPAPPADALQQIAEQPIDSSDTAQTTRQKYELHKTDPSCRSCHQHFDVIGFGMEDMDAIGRYRTTENGLPIDASGELNATDVDGAFTGTAELSMRLASSALVRSCFVQQFFRFAAARPASENDRCTVDAWAERFEHSGGDVRALIDAYVTDPRFLTRRDDR